MRTAARVRTIALTLAVIAIAVSARSANLGTDRQDQPTTPPKPGSYQQVATDGDEVKAAARFAVAQQRKTLNKPIRFVGIDRAEQQVVAGANYKLCLRVIVSGQPRTAMTVVYQDLARELSMTSWQWDICGSESTAARVTGTVAYRERMALPPDAVITVQLADVSIADAPAKTIDQQTFKAGGKQPPYAFELNYDPATIDPRHDYAVQARIEEAGKLLFINTTRASVITHGRPLRVDVMLQRAR